MTTVRIANLTSSSWTGWCRATVDDSSDLKSFGILTLPDGSEAKYCLGRAIGTARVVDINLTLAGATRIHLDLLDNVVGGGQLPDEIKLPTTQPLCVGGHPLTLLDASRDGAAIVAHLRDRRGDFVINVWLRWYPGDPVVHGETLVVNSNPMSPTVIADVDRESWRMSWNGAVAVRPGPVADPIGPLYLLEVDKLADGQGKHVPFAFVFTHMLTDDNWRSAMVSAMWGISAIGDTQLLPEGQPDPMSAEDAAQWGNALLPEAFLRHAGWEAPVCGPALVSGVTGRQEDQIFHPGREAIASPGCEMVRLLSSMKLHVERPCNHIEADGTPLNIDLHPQLMMWDGRPFVAGPFNDRLGKLRALTAEEASNRWGPDVQHFCTSSLLATARQTGSRAAQWLLRQLATIYLLQRTTDPIRQGTTNTSSAREWGYEGWFVIQCWRTLEDRAYAMQLRERLRARLQRLFLERHGASHIYVFEDTPSLGNGKWVIGWQEAFGAYGIDLAGEWLADMPARGLAYRVARDVIYKGWVETPDGWLSRAQYPIEDGAQLPLPNDDFNAFGMCLAPEVILRSPFSSQEEIDRASAILRHVYTEEDFRWLPTRRKL